MALRFPDRLESNNPNAYGIVKANLVSGHKSVKAITDLYTLADAILSDSGNGTDAIGQRWFVIDDNHYYELVNWVNRKQASGWNKIDIQAKLNTKVDKAEGKSLVEDNEITKLKELPNKENLDSQIAVAKLAGDAAQANLTTHIGNTNNPHNVTKALLEIGNVDNTSDLDKPISTATQTALDKKVDKVQGKQLSTNDYTTDEKTKLAGLSNYDDTVVKLNIANLESNKLDSVTYTAQDVLTKLKTVDGAGSGLEADIIRWEGVLEKPIYATRWPMIGEVLNPDFNYCEAGHMHFSFLPFIETAGTNMFAMARANDEIKVERSTNNGVSWVDVTATEANNVRDVFSGVFDGAIYVSAPGGKGVVGHHLRITFSPKKRYCTLAFMYIWANAAGGECVMDIEQNKSNNKNVWEKIISDVRVAGWSGPNIYGLNGITFDGYDNDYYGLRMTFKQTATSTEYTGNVNILQIRAYSSLKAWTTPLNNPLCLSNTPYEITDADLATNFPGTLKCKNQEVFHTGNLILDKLEGVAKKAEVATSVEWVTI